MDEIKGIARVKFHPGKLEEWKRLTKEAVDIVRTKDTGTLQYEIFFNEDETEAIVFERYRDADAALKHFSNIGHLMAPLMATASVTGEVLGTPNVKNEGGARKGRPDALHAMDRVVGAVLIAPKCTAKSNSLRRNNRGNSYA